MIGTESETNRSSKNATKVRAGAINAENMTETEQKVETRGANIRDN